MRSVRKVDIVLFVAYVLIMTRPKKGIAPRSITQPSGEGHSIFPEPHELLQEAQKEIGHGDLKSYTTVIATLRKKGFSFREIAEWLNARGVPTNHNAVYRIFTNCLASGEVEDIEESCMRSNASKEFLP